MTKKTDDKPTAEEKKSKATKSKTAKSWRKKLLVLSAKLLLVMFAVIGGYGIYLDGKIEQKFSHDHWDIPAKVYAQSLSLKPRQAIARNQVINELEELNYRRVSNPSSPGEYSVSKTKIDINRRAFNYVDGPHPAKRVMLNFKGSYLSSITTRNNKESLTQFNIEPKLLQRIRNSSKEDRLFVPREEFPELLIAALIHIEDRKFYQHKGIAPLSIIRAMVANIKAGRTVQGGSTLTQQLVKNVFLTRERSLWRKVKEAYYSILIEFKYSKDELLEIYLNEVFLGQNGALSVNGFGLASEFYFARPINELTPDQIALLVAMIKGPSYYNPKRYQERALKRRNLILRQLLSEDYISIAQYKKAVDAKLGLKNSVAKNGEFHGFMSLVRRELATRFTQDFSKSSGISIFTTLDSSAQRFAQQSLTKRIKLLEKSKKTNDLEGAMIVANYKTGEIKAIVEGKNKNFAGFNRALNAVRPIGSLIKPFVLATALEDAARYNLATPLKDKPISLKDGEGNTWKPLNYDKKYREQTNLFDALTHSYNIPFVNLGMDVGLDNISYTLNRAGWNNEVKLLPSMLLGALESSPWQMTQLYQSLANQGEKLTLHAVIAVTNDSNDTFYGYNKIPVQAISPPAAYLTKYAMAQVTKTGTAKSLTWRNKGKRLAGKTGTTDDLRDSWYAGFDNNEATVVWLGRDDNKPTGLTGSSGALTVYSDFVKQRGGVSLSLKQPTQITTGYFNSFSGVASAKGCRDAVTMPVLAAAWQGGHGCNTPKKKQSVFSDFFDSFTE
ncbi:penicillin-binding protein 1B [Psychrobium sp. 1_MG-2023]|uniref:penicillin-binding protein 1B n=1 Tax=Psychrobium sp. 1_MG-2023 TaxID=3062624 RepID=UPI000C34EDE4|nr:penicillin-binding protein 1B [Psychrobium sp. 1_MG-2023]MDP2562169.1 penicillin-binding protein 1B [Psychrobium sp. 1_MG-2023]PKF57161.1 penicillin-binding protein 1B [Alteromonadales bacterium alter-6D02]